MVVFYMFAGWINEPADLLTVCGPPHCSPRPHTVIDLMHRYDEPVHTERQLSDNLNRRPQQKSKHYIVWFLLQSSFVGACERITWKIQSVGESPGPEAQLAPWIQLVLSLNGSAVERTGLHTETNQ